MIAEAVAEPAMLPVVSDEVDREALTPRESGTLHRWRDFAELARLLKERALKAAQQASQGVWQPRKTEASFRSLASDAEALELAFERWEHYDPGADLRQAAIRELMSLRDQGKTMGIEVD